MLQLRIDAQLQQDVERILAEQGLSADMVVSYLYHYIREERNVPDALRVPNAETKEVFEDTDAGKNLVAYSSTAELFAALGV